MGCASSRTTNNELEHTLRLSAEKERYDQRQDKFEKLCQDLLKDIADELDLEEQGSLNKMTQEIISKKGLGGLTEEELQECIKECKTATYIDDYLFNEHDVYDLALELSREANFFAGSSNDKVAKILVDNYSRIFPAKQKGTFLNLSDIKTEASIVNSIFTNFKFNSSYQVESLSFVVDKFLLLNNNLCQGLADIVEIDKKLLSVLVHVVNEENSITQEMLLSMNHFFSSVGKSNSIRFFLLQSFTDGMFTLNAEMEKTLLTLIHRDCLYGLYLGKFGLSDNFIIELGKTIVNCKNLKFIFIDSKTSNINLLDEFVVQGIGRNRSIQVVILAGFNISEGKVAELKQVQKHNDVIKIFEYVKELA